MAHSSLFSYERARASRIQTMRVQNPFSDFTATSTAGLDLDFLQHLMMSYRDLVENSVVLKSMKDLLVTVVFET